MSTIPSAPRWFVAVVIVALLPLFQFPLLLGICPPESEARIFLWLYPIYALTAGYLAWRCYPQRHLMAWILIALLLLSHLAIWLLVNSPDITTLT